MRSLANPTNCRIWNCSSAVYISLPRDFFYFAVLFVLLSFHHGVPHPMTWLSASDTDKAIIQEIETQTDRAAALIAVAYLEERLRSALDARTHRHANVEKEIYPSSGATGLQYAKNTGPFKQPDIQRRYTHYDNRRRSH